MSEHINNAHQVFNAYKIKKSKKNMQKLMYANSMEGM